LSQEPKIRVSERLVVAVGSRIVRIVTRLTVGLGMVALVLSEGHRSGSYTTEWAVVRWVGFTFVVLSLPLVIYDTYLRYRRRRSKERKAKERGHNQAHGGPLY
jgi:hypothetical protein